MTVEGLITCVYASVNSVPLIMCARHQEYTPHNTRYAALHAAVSESDTIPDERKGETSWREPGLCTRRRSLAACSWPACFSAAQTSQCPGTACNRRATPGHCGDKTSASFPGANRYGIVVRQAVVRVRITDQGPLTRPRILDLSYEAARRLDMVRTGAARVKVEVLAAAPPLT